MGVGKVTRWLSEDEQLSWRAWLEMTRLLPEQFNRELTKNHELSLPDFEILIQLSEAPDRRLRMSELADSALSSRSRLSHACDRIEKNGFIVREPCEDDRRGFWAVLTDQGWEKIGIAAAGHVESVRYHLVDLLSPTEFSELGRIARKVSEHVQAARLDSDI